MTISEQVSAQGRFPTLAISSGKGGVGKSTVSLELAMALGRRGLTVGLLDADVYGPDLPMMANLRRRLPTEQLTVWRKPGLRKRIEPLDHLGVRMMSTGFLMGEGQAFGQPAQIVDMLVMRLISQIDWGPLDVLIVDMPPGTGDLQQQVFRQSRDVAALIVVTPQDLAHGDARRLVDFLRAFEVPVVGAVTNMAHVECPGCGEEFRLWREPAGADSIVSHGVRELARIPLVPPASGGLSTTNRRYDKETVRGDGMFDDLSSVVAGLMDLPGR